MGRGVISRFDVPPPFQERKSGGFSGLWGSQIQSANGITAPLIELKAEDNESRIINVALDTEIWVQPNAAAITDAFTNYWTIGTGFLNMVGIVEWGNGGAPPAAAEVDFHLGRVFSVACSYLRVRAFVVGGSPKVGAFASLAEGRLPLNPFRTLSITALVGAGNSNVTIPPFSQRVKIYNVLGQPYTITFGTRTIVVGALNQSGWVDIPAGVSAVNITNNGANPESYSLVFDINI